MDTTMLMNLLERLGWTSLQTVLLVALVALLCRALPSLSAATRCRLWWLVALQAVLGLAWSQPLQLAWLPSPSTVTSTTMIAPAEMLPAAVTPAAPAASQVLDTARVAAPSLPSPPVWAVALAALWSAGVLLMAGRSFGEWRRCRALLATAQPCQDLALVKALQLAADAHGLRRAPRLCISSQVQSPQLVGPFRPVLLLPAGTGALQGDALDLALAHELQHLQRRDLQWGLLPALAQHLFFFHPLLRLAVREYAQAREEAVDAAVVGQQGASRHAYGRLLLQLGVAPAPHLGVASAAPDAGSLKRRLLSLQPRRACPQVLAVALTAAVLAVGVAPMRLVAAPVPPPPAPPRAPAVSVPAPPPAPAAPPRTALPAAPAAPEAPPAPPAPRTTQDSTQVTHGVLHLGNDRQQSHVLLDDGRSFANATLDDLKQAQQDIGGKEPALWFRRGDQRYVIRDPSVIKPLQQAYAGVAELGEQQAALGREQSALGQQQRALGQRQGELGRLQADEARQIAHDAMQAANQALAAIDINQDAAAEAARADHAAQPARQTARRAATEAVRARRAGITAAAQAERRRMMDEAVLQQAGIGGRQAAIGSRQAALAHRQTQLTTRASRQVQQAIDSAMVNGKAERL